MSPPRPWFREHRNSKILVLLTQFYNRYGVAAPFVGLANHTLDERMRGKKLRKAFAEGACAVAVDDANARAISQGGFVEELIDAASSFFDRGADHIDFIGGA